MPWAAPDGSLRYLDLKRSPELINEIPETQGAPELGNFFLAINFSNVFETAKCDVWSSDQLDPEEEIFEASTKFGGYIDLLFSEDAQRFSFERHEQTVRKLVKLLQQESEIPAAAEFLVRRCYYHVEVENEIRNEIKEGFYITLYVFGYGNNEGEARMEWAAGLKLIEDSIQQLSVF